MSKLDLSKVRGFKYSPKSGLIYRNNSRWKKALGPIKNLDREGYVCVTYQGYKIRGHRLAFYLMGQFIPEKMVVDHINGVKNDNRWENLRLVTVRENCRNQKIHRNGKLTGAVKTKWGYQSYIRIDGRRYGIGYFKTPEQAHEAYINAPVTLKEFLDYRKQFASKYGPKREWI